MNLGHELLGNNEHSLNYKYQGEYHKEILERLERASENAFVWMKKMSEFAMNS